MKTVYRIIKNTKVLKGFIIIILFFGLFLETALGQSTLQPISISIPHVAFTNPSIIGEGKKDPSLFEEISQLINAVPSGETIHVAVFKLNEPLIIRALLQAEKRGVSVNVIIDEGSTSNETNLPTIPMLEEKINTFYAFDNDISKKSIIHNKFLICSKIVTTKGKIPNIILQTSANFQKKDAEKLQDLLIIQNKKIYDGYLKYWKIMEKLGKNNNWDSYAFFTASDDKSGYSANFLPLQKKDKSEKKDVVLDILKQIDNPTKTKIFASITKWDEGRDKVLEKLEQLQKKGTEMKIIISKLDDKEMRELIKDAADEVNVLNKKEARMHTRYILIDGIVNGEQTQLILTGSPNLTKRSLRYNFEVLLVLENHEHIFKQYISHFEACKALD
ncbi:phospholipase D-like domain-containing protein [Flammeovirgaceae bacterium SG7u.111]|nr:phospholipase D-like domain-containing protein [Flammeovirgaceae bacterium SG7u.132]WPO36198.1 phospholipase D-like domain-containing protein [Flammeovirgaceae bacterium SG7u.111]